MEQPVQHRALDTEDGLTLIEVLAAVFVLSISIIALVGVAGTTLNSLGESRDRQAATDAATSVLEAMRLEDFTSVSLLESDVTSGVVPNTTETDASGNTVYCSDPGNEPIVTTSDASRAIPATSTAGPAGNITVSVVVTWVDDGNDDPCTGGERELKRVTATADWTIRGEAFQTVQQTFVAPAGRGLPLPDFRIGSATAAINLDGPTRADDTSDETCIPHVLRNIGANDSYDFEVIRTSGNEASQSFVPPSVFSSVNTGSSGRWEVRTFFEYPLDPANPDPANIGESVSPNVNLMADVDGNQRPESVDSGNQSIQLPTGDEARIHVCYEPRSVPDGRTDVFEIVFHSRFDENATRSVEHTVTTFGVEERLYLFHDNLADPPVNFARNLPNNRPKIYTMGPIDTVQPGKLGPADNVVQNFDTDRDPDALGGTWLEDEGDPDADLVWHEQFSAATTIRSGTLTLYVRPSTATPTEPVGFDYAVEVLRSNENQVIESRTGSFTVPSDGTTGGWWRIDTPIITSDLQLTAGQYLRLRLSCDGNTDCHVAYDDEDTPSYLSVTVG